MTTNTVDPRIELVCAARAKLNLSRAKFAELVGLTPTKITNIEKGRTPTDEEWAALYPHVTDAYPAQAEQGAGEAVSPTPEPSPAPAPPAPTPEEPTPIVEQHSAHKDNSFSNSEVQTFKRCRRKWWLAFYRKLGIKEPQATGTRSIGNRIHDAFAQWYTPVNSRNPFEVLEEGFAHDMEAFPDQAQELERERELCRAMLEGFFQWLAEEGIDQGLSIVGTEETLELPVQLADGRVVYIRGRLDVRIRREADGAVLFRDWKTVGNFSEPQRTLHMDEQMLMYQLLEYLKLQAEGQAAVFTDGALYTMLRRVKRTASAKPPFYDQVEVRHNIHELQSMYMRIVGEITEILRLREQLDSGADPRMVAYPSPTRNCTWDCDFFPVCPMFDDGSNAEGMLEALYAEVDPYARYESKGIEA